MPRTIGLNRAGSVWVIPEDVAFLAQHEFWYRVDFRHEFGDAQRDFTYHLLHDAKVRILPILLWGSGRPTSLTDWQRWKTYVQSIVKRYPEQTHWQLWNEPNNSRVEETYFNDRLDAWRGFLRRTSHYVKEAHADARVIAGGVAVGGHGSQRIRDFPEGWFNVNEVVDRVAIHTYVSDPAAAAKAINDARRVAPQPVWCTELGRKSTVDGEAQQAEWYRRVRDATTGVPLFWFDLQDVDGAFDGFGALRRDRTPKPVMRSLIGS